MHKYIETSVEDRVATLTINRPDCANALSGDCVSEITDAINSFDADDSVGVVVITGRGKHFSAGGDINRFKI